VDETTLTQTAEEWPVFNGVPEVTFTVEGDTRTFTGGYCRATGGDFSQIVVISGDETWLKNPLWSGEGIKLRAAWPYDVGPFWIDVQVGDHSYHTSYEQVASLEDRHTALALSADQRFRHVSRKSLELAGQRDGLGRDQRIVRAWTTPQRADARVDRYSDRGTGGYAVCGAHNQDR